MPEFLVSHHAHPLFHNTPETMIIEAESAADALGVAHDALLRRGIRACFDGDLYSDAKARAAIKAAMARAPGSCFHTIESVTPYDFTPKGTVKSG